jgi:hypothetical protein
MKCAIFRRDPRAHLLIDDPTGFRAVLRRRAGTPDTPIRCRGCMMCNNRLDAHNMSHATAITQALRPAA